MSERLPTALEIGKYGLCSVTDLISQIVNHKADIEIFLDRITSLEAQRDTAIQKMQMVREYLELISYVGTAEEAKTLAEAVLGLMEGPQLPVTEAMVEEVEKES